MIVVMNRNATKIEFPKIIVKPYTVAEIHTIMGSHTEGALLDAALKQFIILSTASQGMHKVLAQIRLASKCSESSERLTISGWKSMLGKNDNVSVTGNALVVLHAAFKFDFLRGKERMYNMRAHYRKHSIEELQDGMQSGDSFEAAVHILEQKGLLIWKNANTAICLTDLAKENMQSLMKMDGMMPLNGMNIA